jgi:hypothetical protein
MKTKKFKSMGLAQAKAFLLYHSMVEGQVSTCKTEKMSQVHNSSFY